MCSTQHTLFCQVYRVALYGFDLAATTDAEKAHADACEAAVKASAGARCDAEPLHKGGVWGSLADAMAAKKSMLCLPSFLSS